LEKPSKELKAFAKTSLLNPGQSQDMTFHVSTYEMASYVESVHSWIADAGTYMVSFCKDADTVVSEVPFKLKKAYILETEELPELNYN